MNIKRHLLVTIFACVALVGITASVQVNKQRDKLKSQALNIEPQTEAPKTDPAFLDNTSKIPIITKKALPTIPGLTAKAYLVGNVKTGKIYIEQNSSQALPVASMSKLVTAFAATDMMSSTTAILISSSTLSVPPDTSNLTVGEKFTLEEILKPLLLSSSNVAAEAISVSGVQDRTNFLEMMSSYAWEIGMPKSFFADPSGVSPLNIASAKDLFELAKYLMYHRPDILAITRTAETTIATTTEHGGHVVVSTHPFVKDQRFVGGKTGRTIEAGETMMTILNIDGEFIVFIILGSKYGARENDTRILIRELEKKM